MKRANWFIIIVLALGAVFGIFTSTLGQAASENECIVKLGDYRNLTFLRQLKIGAAEYVNPALFNTAAVAYRYDPSRIGAIVGWETIFDDLRSGQVALASASDGVYGVVDIGSDAFTNILLRADKQKQDWGAELLSQDAVLISTLESLHGVPASGRLVSWDATSYLSTPKVKACPQ